MSGQHSTSNGPQDTLAGLLRGPLYVPAGNPCFEFYRVGERERTVDPARTTGADRPGWYWRRRLPDRPDSWGKPHGPFLSMAWCQAAFAHHLASSAS